MPCTISIIKLRIFMLLYYRKFKITEMYEILIHLKLNTCRNIDKANPFLYNIIPSVSLYVSLHNHEEYSCSYSSLTLNKRLLNNENSAEN